MKVRYSLTFTEYYRSTLQRFRTLPAISPVTGYLVNGTLLFVMLGPLAALAYVRYILKLPMSSVDMHHFELAILALSLEAPIIFLIITPLSWLLHQEKQLEIDTEGLVYIPRKRRIRVPWRAVMVLKEDAADITIAGKPAPSITLVVTLPKRAFATEKAAREFFETAVAYRDEAISGRPPQASAFWPPEPLEREKSAP